MFNLKNISLKNSIKPRVIVVNALMIALAVVLTRVLSIRIPLGFGGVEGVRIGFGPLPIILSGLIGGPISGGITGAFADVIGYFVNPMGPYLPHFTATAALTGIIPGILNRVLPGRIARFLRILTIITVTQIAVGLILTPILLYKTFGIPLKVNIPIRLATQVFAIPAYSIILHAILTKGAYVLGRLLRSKNE